MARNEGVTRREFVAASLQNYGKKGPYHYESCRSCPKKGECSYYWDITKDPRLVSLYVDCEKADGYLRDGCVFKEDVNIPDTMNGVVRYSNGVTMSYSLNAFRDLIFRKVDAPEYMKLPGSRAGAMSCLTGIAARKSVDTGLPVKIADLVRV
jgi:hypothetical protein